MVQIDVYDDVHRRQRSRLFALVEEVGMLLPGDRPALERALEQLDCTLDELRAHAAVEELLLHPLLDAVAPVVAKRLHDGHILIEGYLVELHASGERARASVSQVDLAFLYRLLAKFTGGYLFHISCEEDEGGSALRASLEPRELERVHEEFCDAHLASSMLAEARSR